MPKNIYVVVTGSTFPAIRQEHGDFGAWIAQGLGTSMPVRLVDARTGQALPHTSDIAGVIVSGSHEMVTARATWSEALGDWLRLCVQAEVPVLGICYGHQLLAHACGGEVGFRDEGIEIGTIGVTLLADAQDDPLFAQLPSVFPAHVVHQQSVMRLPNGARLLARSEAEAVQAFRLGRCVWGVQFHPEFSSAAMRGYIAETRQGNSSILLDQVAETPAAALLLRHFGAYIEGLHAPPDATQSLEGLAAHQVKKGV